MPAGVDAKLLIQIAATLTASGDLGDASQKVALSKEVSFSPGSASVSQADVMFSDTRTLAASATEDLDLTGALTNAFGATVTQAEVVAIYVHAASTNTNSVILGGAAANQFTGPLGAGTHTLTLKPDEAILLTSPTGWTVTAGTGDLLKVANSAAGTSVKYSIIVIGRTVAQ